MRQIDDANVIATGLDILPDASYNYITLAFAQTSVPGAPVIAVPPQSRTVYAGSDVTFTATGDNLRYQWRNFGTNLPGATNATMTITNVQPDDCGQYSVRIDNDVDYTISPEALLTVHTQFQPPALQPDGKFRLAFIGEPDRDYAIQSSTNLVHWSDAYANLTTPAALSKPTSPFQASNPPSSTAPSSCHSTQ